MQVTSYSLTLISSVIYLNNTIIHYVLYIPSLAASLLFWSLFSCFIIFLFFFPDIVTFVLLFFLKYKSTLSSNIILWSDKYASHLLLNDSDTFLYYHCSPKLIKKCPQERRVIVCTGMCFDP